MNRPLGFNATLVLQALSHGAGYGFEVMSRTSLPAGTVYPILRRLEAAGALESRWEADAEVVGEGRPRRRYYAVTPFGAEVLAESRERILAQQGLLEGRSRGPGA